MIRKIPLAKIVRNADQPRRVFDQAKLNALAADIKLRGVRQAIEVRPLADGMFGLVAGERRFRASQIAGMATIKASVLGETDDETAYRDAVAENLHRAEMTIIEEAEAFYKLMGYGDTVEEIAARYSQTVVYVNMRLSLLALRSEVRDMVDSGAIKPQAAHRMSKLTAENQLAVMLMIVQGRFESDNALVHFIFAMERAQEQPSLMIVEDMTPQEREERIKKQRTTRTDLERIQTAEGLLKKITKLGDAELAVLLHGEVGQHIEALDRLGKAVQAARFQLKQARALQDAYEILANPEAVQEASDDDAEGATAPEVDGEPVEPEDDAETSLPEGDGEVSGEGEQAGDAIDGERELSTV